MKKCTLLCLGSLLLLSAYAQDDPYLPLVAENRTWSVLNRRMVVIDDQTGSMVTDLITEHFRIDTAQDSIVDGKVWHPVYISRDTVFDWDDTGLELSGIIREEDRRIHYRGKYSSFFDIPMYDFNLLPGDTIEKTTNDIGEPIFFVVADVDTVILDDGIARKRLHTGYWHKSYNDEAFEFFPSTIVWVEGIGDLTHGLLPQWGFQVFNPRYADRLLCLTTDQTSAYTNPAYEGCFIEHIVSGLKSPFELPIRIFPNPMAGHLRLEGLQNLAPGILRVTDPLGRLQFQKKLDGLIPDLEIDVSDWPANPYQLNYQTFNARRYRSMILLKITPD